MNSTSEKKLTIYRDGQPAGSVFKSIDPEWPRWAWSPNDGPTLWFDSREKAMRAASPAQQQSHAASFTPGPWKANGRDVYTLSDTKPFLGVCIARCDVFRTEHQANARLIASAPALLEALKEICDCTNEKYQFCESRQMSEATAKWRECVDTARIAIASATISAPA